MTWSECARELDDLEQNYLWKQTFECADYDPDLVQERIHQLNAAREGFDVSRMLFLIRTSLNRDLGNMSNVSLYRHAHLGTKHLIDRYIKTALATITALVELTDKNHCDGHEAKYILDQLLAARQAFGRSALLFSGGATFGMNHIGVLKALWQANSLPRIISGASAGSIVCAVFCTRTDEELPDLLDSYVYGDFKVFGHESEQENIFQKTARFLKYGSFLDISHLAKVMRSWLGDMTFQEAYNRTRRILNICVSSAGVYELPKLLNYITAPNVMIWSAVAVSCSVPLIFSPYPLMAKDPLSGEPVPWSDIHRQFIDGSVDGDLPMTRLSEMFNVNHFIVSQVNPHVVPFLPKDEGPDQQFQSSFALPNWLHGLSHLAMDETLYRMTLLSELGIFPNSLTKTVSIATQKYSGDINIYPEIRWSRVPAMLANPTTDFMLEACISGERATWPKLHRIYNHCAIELALDSAVQEMRARVAFYPSRINTKSDSAAGHALESVDTSAGRGRTLNRRSSYNHEIEQLTHVKHTPPAPSTQRPPPTRPFLQRSRSVLLCEQSHGTDSMASVKLDGAVKQRKKSYRSPSIKSADGRDDPGSGTDEETDIPAPPIRRMRRHVSWEPSSDDHFSWMGQGQKQRQNGGHVYASHEASARAEGFPYSVHGMTETPSRHLRMTPAAYPRSPTPHPFRN
ncbi:patatin-domain-containing protein [Aspergillus heteromorphus CBS 117.55]|uniref:Patatin-like phospholipase domain-containing protein n=1 Tax=Aspergillus heteromorphus CBS 117.55 TaxID=1448321 RepID=A0A317WLT7_9EURO|nr:patatin-domain-containing protein [Aspergillus heteromorphus CBS 117.55]PWY86017.1 patatin-domain-containing protein [Aspergillus heteromorphus CBS 117.55]